MLCQVNQVLQSPEKAFIMITSKDLMDRQFLLEKEKREKEKGRKR